MEVAMSRTALRHMLSALAAVALVSVCSSSPVSAQASQGNLHVFNPDFTPGLTSGAGNAKKQEPKTLKGLTTQKGSAAKEVAEINAKATIQAAKEASE
jgi:ABC-type sugar transport system substrate-binding protein